MYNKCQRNAKEQSRIDNPETLATLSTQDTGQRQTKQTNKNNKTQKTKQIDNNKPGVSLGAYEG